MGRNSDIHGIPSGSAKEGAYQHLVGLDGIREQAVEAGGVPSAHRLHECACLGLVHILALLVHLRKGLIHARQSVYTCQQALQLPAGVRACPFPLGLLAKGRPFACFSTCLRLLQKMCSVSHSNSDITKALKCSGARSSCTRNHTFEMSVIWRRCSNNRRSKATGQHLPPLTYVAKECMLRLNQCQCTAD